MDRGRTSGEQRVDESGSGESDPEQRDPPEQGSRLLPAAAVVGWLLVAFGSALSPVLADVGLALFLTPFFADGIDISIGGWHQVRRTDRRTRRRMYAFSVILAGLGVIGFAAFLWLLVITG